MSELREDLRSTISELSAPVEVASHEPEPAPVVAEPVVATAAEADSDVGGQPPDESKGPGRARAPDGKFVAKAADVAKGTESKTPAPKQGAPTPVKPTLSVVKSPAQAPQPTPSTPSTAVTTAPVQGAQSETKPPQSWKASVREKWNALPGDVREEIDRVNREASTNIQKHAEAAKFRDSFQQTLAPYQAMLGGADPVKATQNLLQTAHVLHYAPPQQKAQMVANMVRQFGIPIEALDAALSGTSAPQQGAQSQTIDPESILQQAEERMMKRFQAQQDRQETARIQKDIDTFRASHEFFHDVEPDMTQLVTLARGRGVELTIEQAYDRAVQLSPEIQATLKQREAAKLAPTAQAATERSKAAASSVKSQPAVSGQSAKPDSVRGSIRESIAELVGRGR